MNIPPFTNTQRGQQSLFDAIGKLALRALFLRQLFQPVPQLHIGQELGLVVVETGMGLIGRFTLMDRTITRILHGHGRGHDQHFRQTMMFMSGQNHAGHTRVHGQLGQGTAYLGQALLFIQRTQLLQNLIAIGNRTASGRLHKGEGFHIVQMQGLHAQNHRGQRGTQNLGIRKGGAALDILLVIQRKTDTGPNTTATPCPLAGRCLTDRFNTQLLDLVAPGIALDTRQTTIDHKANAGHGQRGFCHIGRQHHTARIAFGSENTFLIRLRQTRKQGQDHGIDGLFFFQRLGGFADFTLTRQEDQNVARTMPGTFLHRIHNALHQIPLFLGGGTAFFGIDQRRVQNRAVHNIDGIQTARHFNDRRLLALVGKVLRETFGINCGRGNNQLQVRTTWQQLL